MSKLSLIGLTKRFGSLAAVSHLNLEVKEGEVLGFLGLNGAGKTTTIRILLDLLRPIYSKTAAYGHFGREEFPWEATDKAALLRDFAGIK